VSSRLGLLDRVVSVDIVLSLLLHFLHGKRTRGEREAIRGVGGRKAPPTSAGPQSQPARGLRAVRRFFRRLHAERL